MNFVPLVGRISFTTLSALVLSCAVSAEAATIHVRAGDNLQAALNAAQPGDTLLLQAGATFIGNFVLPVKSGQGYITVRSSAADAVLPPATARITPADAPNLPKIVSTNSAPALRAALGSHHWRLLFLEFPATYRGYGEIVRIGEGSSEQSTAAQVPYEFVLDRVYIHGDKRFGQKRGVALNGRSVTIRNSFISEIKAIGMDTQAIAGWNGPGPFLIENNYLEAAGENFLLGGSDPFIPNLVSENVVIRYNHMSRPMSWRDPIVPAPKGISGVAAPGGTLPAGTYGYRIVARRLVGSGSTARSAASAEITVTVPVGSGSVKLSWPAGSDATDYVIYRQSPSGTSHYWTSKLLQFTDSGAAGQSGEAPSGSGDTWVVKNLFELKNARNVLVEYNVFENNWRDGQPGYAILFTPRNQDGRCNWCVVEDVTFQHNVVRNVAGGINILGYDNLATSRQTQNIRILNNLFTGVTKALGGSGWYLLIGASPRNVVVDHNTVDADGSALVYAYGGTASTPEPIYGLRLTNNAVRHNSYGINGANFAWGMEVLTAYFPDSAVSNNWLQGGTASRYPAGNLFSSTFASAFVNAAAGDYRLAPGSVLAGAGTGGTNIGADAATLLSRVRDVVEGQPGYTRPLRPFNLRVVDR